MSPASAPQETKRLTAYAGEIVIAEGVFLVCFVAVGGRTVTGR